MKTYYLTDAEINNLKSRLMNKKNSSFPLTQTSSNEDSLSKAFYSLYKQSKNTDNGNSFEENIKSILKIEYGWADAINNSHFFYRTIQIGSKQELIKLGYSKKLIINGRKYKFVFNSNQSLSIFIGCILRRFIVNVSEKSQVKILVLNNTKIIISKVNEIEIDGFFKIISNNIDKIINDDDIICLYRNIDDYKANNAKYACCQIKLSLQQINKLIKQLKKHQNSLENIIGFKSIIYIGFVGVGKINKNLISKLKKIKDLDILILQINNCHWLKRNLTQNIDWETYSLYKSLKNENALLHNENAILKEKVDSLSEKYDILFEFVKNSLSISNAQFLGKKKRRELAIQYN